LREVSGEDKKTFDEHCAMPYITHFFNDVRLGLVENEIGDRLPFADKPLSARTRYRILRVVGEAEAGSAGEQPAQE